MNDPKIHTKVVHSKTNPAWNVVGTKLGGKYKIARVPYIVCEEDEQETDRGRDEALLHAKFISACFNNSKDIINFILN